MGLFDKFKGKVDNFDALNKLIQKGEKDIVLDCDITYNHGSDFIYKENRHNDFLPGIVISQDSVCIDGNGHTIDGKAFADEEGLEVGFETFFRILGTNITIKNLTFKNCLNYAIFNKGYLSLENCKFENIYSGRPLINQRQSMSNLRIYSRDSAACLHNESGILIIHNTEFINNSAYKGAIRNYDGVIKCYDCNFDNNTAHSWGGGAINNDYGEISLVRCHFEDNEALMGGGGAISNSEGIIQLYECNFLDNSSSSCGGAIRNDNILSCEDSKFEDNESSCNCQISNNGKLYSTDPDIIEYVCGGEIFNEKY